jgi:Domain of unknown function (DUF4389)
MADHPIRLVVDDDLHRSRLTVFFRLLLAIPHFIWITLWGIAVLFAAIVGWFAALFTGRLPQSLHNFSSAYVRYWTHLQAYLLLAANPYPGFLGEPGTYSVDLEIDGPERQSRWKTGFRLLLAIPVLLLATLLAGDAVPGGFGGGDLGDDQDRSGRDFVAFFSPAFGGLLGVVSFLAWFACLARGRSPQGFRDLFAYGLRYGGQASGYFLLLTDRYPSSDPATPAAAQPVPWHPIRLRLEDDLPRSRLTVFFRLLLFLPHYVWLSLWGIAALLALIVNWFATLVLGRSPNALHRFLSAYVRYQAHAYAFLMLVGNPFPGFTGEPGSYPVDIEIDPPERQNRWVTGFRLFLALPALVVAYLLGIVLYLVAIFGWFVGLALGRMPEGLRNLGAHVVRYWAQTYSYIYLLTDRYPYSGPLAAAEEEPAPVAPVAETV